MNNLGQIYFNNKYKDTYFEGWYFKNITKDLKYTISIIVGISRNKNKNISFIQVIDNNNSYYKEFKYEDFCYDKNTQTIIIDNNYFNINKINVSFDNIKIDLNYNNIVSLKDDIMGIFKHISLECYHSIISMRHRVNGVVEINKKKTRFKNGYGYIEKDYGKSFPKQYLWGQAINNRCSLFIAIATIPYKILKFEGFICSLKIDKEYYIFSTYNFAKLKKIITNDRALITLKRKDVTLYLEFPLTDGYELKSPKLGAMNGSVLENINNLIKIRLTINKEIIYEEQVVATTEKF